MMIDMMTFDSAPQGDRKNIKVAKHSVPFSFNFFSTTTTKESLAIILIKKDCRQATHIATHSVILAVSQMI